MRITDLMITNVNITEDEYSYGASFVISAGSHELRLDLSDLDNPEKLNELKGKFELAETVEGIRKYIFDAVMENAGLTSRNKQGEHYDAESDKKTGNGAASLDMA